MEYKENRFRDIIDSGLCLGCGLCEAVGRERGYLMKLMENGFYEPINEKQNDDETEKIISHICPAININAPVSDGNNSVWGNMNDIHKVFATDALIRRKASSGGGLSAICVYLIESKKVDAILHVGRIEGTIHNGMFISKTKRQVINNCSSRYAPAQVFNNFSEILNKSKETYAFIGKPCDISGLKNFLNIYPQFKDRFIFFLSFFCAGMPSYNATLKLLKTADKAGLPISLKYRGNGWPSYFTANYNDGHTIKVSYEESWGKILGRHVHPRCKICPDGVGLMADLVFGDAWETDNGYPKFDEKDGFSLAISRTNKGSQLMNGAIDKGYLQAFVIDEEKIKAMQPFQYQRRLFVGYRIIVVQILTRSLLNFNNTGFLKLMKRYPLHKGIKNAYGTLKRFLPGKS